MNRCLILLTTAFPFAGGEAYLEAELPALATRFTHIFLFAIGLEPGMAPTVTMPKNVTVCNCADRPSKQAKLRDVLHGVPTVFKTPTLPADDLREAGQSPARRAFLGYFLSRTKRHTAEITRCLQCMDLSVFDEIVLYSYWLFAAASTAASLKPVLLQQGAKRIRFVSRAHRYDIYADKNALHYLPCRTSILQAADAVYTCSVDGQNYLVSRYPAYREKIHTAYLGAAAGEMTSGSADGVIRILSCGRVVPHKRQERIADALRLLPRDVRAEWTHIGDGPAMTLLQKKIETLPGNITVRLPGEMPHGDVLRYYRSHPTDMFVSVSRSEGLPVSAMEALSFGVPVIVTDVGGCAELLADNANGVLLPEAYTDTCLAEAMQTVAATDDAGRRIPHMADAF